MRISEVSSVLDSKDVVPGLKMTLAAKAYSVSHQRNCSYFMRFEDSESQLIKAGQSSATAGVVD